MATTRVRGAGVDPAPRLRSAGKNTFFPDESVEVCLKSEIVDPHPPTPQHVAKFRTTGQIEPGRHVLHYGLVDDLKDFPPPGVTFGRRTGKSLGAADVINGMPKSEFEEMLDARKEQTYSTASREPVGRPFVRGHVLPEKASDPNYRFGSTTRFDEPVKNLIYPEDQALDDNAHELYVKTHGAYEVAEQKRRNYEWERTGVDPGDFRFGKRLADEYRDGVKKALNPALDEGLPPPTEIVDAQVIAHKKLTSDELGKCRTWGQGPRDLPPNHVFGKPSNKGQDWGTKECVGGAYSMQEQEPDSDLGRSVHVGWRNIALEKEKRLGVPSIRTDIMPPKLKSVSSQWNYGDEADAMELLYPSRFALLGIHEEQFLKVIPKEEIRQVMIGAGVVKLEDFDGVYEKAKSYDDSGQNRVNIDTFRRALLELQFS
mmetsp:Transcript_36017/g.58208  ORF Transcript_36017/g.58208 Transcript_36017/m.58208 type:complete len:428 (+) Transcript_36017:68-1351(+)